MAMYFLLGIIIMWLIEWGSPYLWTVSERFFIIIFWPIALGIILYQLIMRFLDE